MLGIACICLTDSADGKGQKGGRKALATGLSASLQWPRNSGIADKAAPPRQLCCLLKWHRLLFQPLGKVNESGQVSALNL